MPHTNLITISDIKNCYENNTDLSAKDKLKTKLNGLINEGEWEFTDIVEHDYSLAPIVDCLKYYIAGYLTHQITKRSSCQKCKTSIMSNECFTSEADLTNIKSRGWLKHPNKYLYELLSVVEDELMNHLGKTSVYEDTVEALITKCETFTFPCGEHKDFIIASIIKYYINMRMRQWTRQTNQEQLKENAKKKKLSKFCKS
ncbi:unnamed protein product [Macrosiphum euphorbiae]|uniref:Uncharacterized protein n=1 Tax=Macrosiphum euphorbiae TaxID=13131 RepID=A0AAV0WPT7_9HEMI|nr:unnamed protein product [Macrosiphum euphorbiae]